jgi:hypothetical protein
MSDPQKRSTHLFYLARRWIQRDPTAAQAWMSTTPDLSADTKQKLITTYAHPQQAAQ